MNPLQYKCLSELERSSSEYLQPNLDWSSPASKPEFPGYFGRAEIGLAPRCNYPAYFGQEPTQDFYQPCGNNQIREPSWNPLHAIPRSRNSGVSSFIQSTEEIIGSIQKSAITYYEPRTSCDMDRLSDISQGDKVRTLESDPVICSPETSASARGLEGGNYSLARAQAKGRESGKDHWSRSTLLPTFQVAGTASETFSHDDQGNTLPNSSRGGVATRKPIPPREGVPSPKLSNDCSNPLKEGISRSKLHLSAHMRANVERNQFLANIRFNHPAIRQSIGVQTLGGQKLLTLSLVDRLKQLCSEGVCGAEVARSVSQDILLAQVLVVKGFDWETFKLKELTSLFSNYGNIHFGASFPMLGCASIMYTTKAGADLGLQHLKSLNVRGTRVKVERLQHFEGLDPCYLVDRTEVYVPPAAHRRFKQEIPRQANGVSSTLHVCVFYPGKRRVVTNAEIAEHFKIYGVTPQQMRRDPNPEHFNMWFADFKNLSEAIVCLMRTHDSPFEEGNVRISFTKSKKSSEYKRRGE